MRFIHKHPNLHHQKFNQMSKKQQRRRIQINSFNQMLDNLYKLSVLLILVVNFNQQVLAAKGKALIYNKDGKFIYRPAKANQGHIIVIDDRHHHHDKPDQQHRSSDPEMAQAYQPIQLITPTRFYHHQPAMGLATAATGFNQQPAAVAPVQFISLNELPSISHPLAGADSRFFRSTAAAATAAAAARSAGQIQVIPLVPVYSPRQAQQQQPPQQQPQATLMTTGAGQQKVPGAIYTTTSTDYYNPMIGNEIVASQQQHPSMPDGSQYGMGGQVLVPAAGNPMANQLIGFRPGMRQRAFSDQPMDQFDSMQVIPSYQQEVERFAQTAPRRLSAMLNNLEYDDGQGGHGVQQDHYSSGDVFDDSPPASYHHQAATRNSQAQQATNSLRPQNHGANYDSAMPGFIPPPAPQEDDGSYKIPPNFQHHSNSERAQRHQAELGGEKPARSGKFFNKKNSSNKQQQNKPPLENKRILLDPELTGSQHHQLPQSEQVASGMNSLADRDTKNANYWSQFKDQYDII